MRLQIHSDIHLERYPCRRVRPIVSRLVLAGDIGVPVFPSYREFFRDTSRQFDSIIYVLGNHEYERAWMGIDKNNYSLLEEKFIERNNLIRNILSEFNNITLLDNNSMMIGKWKVFGATLWTNYHQRRSERKLSSVERFITEKHFETMGKIQSKQIDLLITHFVSDRSVLKKKWNIGLGSKTVIPAKKRVFGHIHYPICGDGTICNPWGEEESQKEMIVDLD